MSINNFSFFFFSFFLFRYKAIVRPMEIQASHALMKICVRAAIIWIASMLLAIPEAVFSDLHPFHDKGTNKTFISCAPYPHSDGLHPKIHSMASFLIFYIIPLSVISVYYYFIAKNLIRSAYNIPVEGNVHVRKQVETLLSSKIHNSHEPVKRDRIGKFTLKQTAAAVLILIDHHKLRHNSNVIFLSSETLAGQLPWHSRRFMPVSGKVLTRMQEKG